MIPRLRWILPLISLAMLVASAAALAWAVLAPCQVFCPETSSAKTPLPKAAKEVLSSGSAQEVAGPTVQALARRQFQRPLFDPPPPPPPVVKPPPPPTVPFTLLATMPESGGGQAMFTDSQGAIVIKSLGEEVPASSGRARLTEITNDHVLFRCEETVITLELGKK